MKSDVLVKTDDTSLLIIRDAIALFENAKLFSDKIVQAKGVDADRMCEYEIMMTDGFTLSGVDEQLSVAWIKEEDLRTREKEEFFVVAATQFLTKPLDAEEMRELGHLRWDVENNGFQELNQTVHTKHLYSHDETASEAILLILFVVFNVFGLYLLAYMSRLTPFEGMKQTRKFAIFLLRCLLIAIFFLDFG